MHLNRFRLGVFPLLIALPAFAQQAYEVSPDGRALVVDGDHSTHGRKST